MQLRLALAAACLVLVTATSAQAYPRFQFTTDNARCSECHISPAGGGLLNEYGRGEAADTISMGGSESFLGDGRPFNGLFEAPEWFRFGGDYRGALIVRQSEDQDIEVLGFPMQVDLYTHVKLGDAISLSVTAGVRGAARDNTRPPVAERFVSREHFVMWRPEDTGPYVRAGRFFPVYGLRDVDHTSVLRRRLGFHVLEEPYAISGGLVEGDQELHATVYTGSPLFSGGRKATGAAGYWEKRIRDLTGAVGAQAKVDFTSEDVRYLAGGVGKLWLAGPKLLLLGELDVGAQQFRTSGPTALQLAAHAGVTYVWRTWLMPSLTLERYENDLTLRESARDSVTLGLQFFPRAHWEIMLLGKLEAQGGAYGDANGYTMLMLHYYL